MPLPQIGGTYTMRHDGDNSAIINISAVPIGGWMIVSVMCSSASSTVSAPGGWTALHAKEVTGTRSNFLYGKVKDAADGNTVTFTQSTTVTVAYGMIWGTAGGEVVNWIRGASGLRANSGEASGARYTNKAPSVTTTGSNYLVIAISHEATLAKAQNHEVTGFTAGWTERAYLEQVVANSQIETIWFATKEMAVAGATNDVTITYVSPVDENGWGIQIAIPYGTPASVTVPQIVGTPTQVILGSITTGFTISRPSGIMNGDYVIVALRNQNASSVEPTSPGFTRLGAAFGLNNATSRTHGFYGRPITDAANEPSSYAFSYSASSGSRVVSVAFIVRGVDLNQPLAGFFNSYSGTSITGGREISAYAIDSVPSLSLFMGSSEFSSPNDHVPLTTPTGFTNFIALPSSTNTAISRTYLWLGTKVEEATPTSQVSITWSGPAGPAAEMITLRGTMSEPVDQEGDGLVSYDGNGDEVRVYYTHPDGIRTPSNLIPMRRGFSSVAQMLATPGFTWAHRGGSASYPEHSLYGYTQSVAKGYGVLEISLGRTSDGVWFGLHDQTTDRTSGGTYGNASSQTWAQIQAQQIVIGSEGAPQPYMRWDELVAIYGSTHIIVADPKYALGSYRTEFLTMVNNDLGPTRAIIKYSGVGSGAASLSTAAKALGFETWGFFYASDASAAQGGSGALQTWGPSWTLIGMEYGASQAIWDEALALGKPIIGHIAPNQTAYNTAISKGASGVQVSGVGVVNPVSWWT